MELSNENLYFDIGTHLFHSFFIVFWRCFGCKPHSLFFTDWFRNCLLLLFSNLDLVFKTCSSWAKFWVWSTFLVLTLEKKGKKEKYIVYKRLDISTWNSHEFQKEAIQAKWSECSWTCDLQSSSWYPNHSTILHPS